MSIRNHLILALTADGQPNQWMRAEDAITAKYKGLVAYEFGDAESLYFGGNSRMTGERSQIEIKSIISIKSQFKFRQRVPALTNMALAYRDKYICGYCAKKITTSANLTRDHIIPVSRNGKDVWQNVVLSCKHCNNKKDNKTPEEAGMSLIWVPYAPTRFEHLLIQNRHILADQVEYIAGFVNEKSRMLEYIKENRNVAN